MQHKPESESEMARPNLQTDFIKPEDLLLFPEWKGSVVEGPMAHSFWLPNAYSRGRRADPTEDRTMAYRVTHPSGAVAWIRAEQPARAPFVVTVTAPGVERIAYGQTADHAKRTMKMLADALIQEGALRQFVNGRIEKAGHTWRFTFRDARKVKCLIGKWEDAAYCNPGRAAA